MPPRQWEPIVHDFSVVMKKVHLLMRRDPVDVEQVYAEIFREKRDAYEDGMTIQAANAGCPGRRGTTPPDVMKEMSDQAHSEAAGIANTYNYDLALAIRAIRVDVPRANRFTYAKRLAAWEATRDEWKSKQISLWNQMQWQDRATADFLSHNPEVNKGWARVEPRGRAVCKICQYWVGRGRVELSEMQKQKWPAHLNCPHYWDTHYQGKVKCEELWLGAPLRDWWEKELGYKGGPGSGNWGHAGRPGMVGGSGGSGGRIYNAGAYLYTKRSAAMAEGVVGDVKAQIQQTHPDLEDYEVEEYLDIMSLDARRFDRYAGKLGVTGVTSEEYFKYVKEVDRQQAKMRWDLEEEAAMKIGGHVAHWAPISADMGQRLEQRVGRSWADAASKLSEDYGVSVNANRAEYVEGERHHTLSVLVNMASESPAFAATLSDHVKSIDYVDQKPGSTAAADYESLSKTVHVYPQSSDYLIPATTMVHEVGHAAEHYVPQSRIPELVEMAKGRTVSTYARGNYCESFAETFVAAVGDERNAAHAWTPDKVEFVESVLRDAGVPL